MRGAARRDTKSSRALLERSQFVEQEARRMAARAAWTSYFNDFDVFLCFPAMEVPDLLVGDMCKFFRQGPMIRQA